MPNPVRPEPVEGLSLRCHPATPARGVRAIRVDVGCWRDADAGPLIAINYAVDADADAICMAGDPGESNIAPEPTDGLWHSTCFELFTGTRPAGGYHEQNFAGNGQWASYRFAAYRTGMGAGSLTPRHMTWCQTPHGLRFTVVAPLAPGAGPQIMLGLCAVIAEMDGTKSYWALAHPPGDRPDFHHPDCFALSLGAPDQA